MKKLNNRGVAHHGLIALVLVLGIVAGAGYVVYQKQSGKTASADNWTDLSGVGGVSLKDDSRILACKKSVKVDGGESWVINMKVHNENYIGEFTGKFEVKREGLDAGDVLMSAKPYSVSKVYTTNFRINKNDTWTGYTSFRTGAVQSFGGPWSFDKISDC